MFHRAAEWCRPLSSLKSKFSLACFPEHSTSAFYYLSREDYGAKASPIFTMREDSTPDPQFQERRQTDRSRLIIEIFFDGVDATGIAHSRDISLGGLYMNTQTEIAEGSQVKLRIPLINKQVIADAQVVYCNPGHGVGVRFISLSDDDRAMLLQELPQP